MMNIQDKNRVRWYQVFCFES